MDDKMKGVLITLISAAAFGAAAPVAKFIYKYDVSTGFMLALRFLIASMFLWGYIFINRRRINYKLEKQHIFIMVIIGTIAYFFTTVFYFNAIKFIPVSLHIMIFFSYPFMVNIFSACVFKEKINKKQIGALLTAFIGLLFTVSISSFQVKMIGILLSLLAALFNGSYNILLGIKKINEIESVVTAAYTSSFSTVSFFIYSAVRKEICFDIPLKGWLWIVFLAVFITAVGIIALSKGIRIIGASKASIVCTFEPLEAMILSVVFLDEKIVVRQVIGMFLILSAIILINRDKTTENINIF